MRRRTAVVSRLSADAAVGSWLHGHTPTQTKPVSFELPAPPFSPSDGPSPDGLSLTQEIRETERKSAPKSRSKWPRWS